MKPIEIGDKVICKESGVVGIVEKIYVPTACEEQIRVLTSDGRKYHAPTRTWVKTSDYDAIKGHIDWSEKSAVRFLEGYRDALFGGPNTKSGGVL